MLDYKVFYYDLDKVWVARMEFKEMIMFELYDDSLEGLCDKLSVELADWGFQLENSHDYNHRIYLQRSL